MIPCESGGEIYYIKIRQPDGYLEGDKYMCIRMLGSGAEHSASHLYGLDDLRGCTDAILCEGEYDALLLRQFVGPLCGVAATGSASKGLDADAIAVLCGVRRVFVAYDSDKPGQDGADKLAALSARMRVIPPPGGEHDITDAWKAGHDLAAWAVEHIGPGDPDKRAAWLAHYLGSVGDGPLRDALQADLDESQRAMVAAELANLPHGTNRYTRDIDASIEASIYQSEAAEMLNVSRGSVQRAAAILKDGVPELAKAVKQGKVADLSPEARLARDRGGVWHEIAAPDWAPADLAGGRRWYASDDDQLVSIA